LTKKILVAEDDLTNQKLLSFALQKMNFNVLIASNGQEAVDQANTEKPDLILMDIMMPVMDGYRALELLKSNPETASIPIVALTARAMLSDRQRAKQAGCNDYIAKPFEITELRNVISKLLAIET